MLGSGDGVKLFLFSPEIDSAGKIQLQFSSTLVYYLDGCNLSYTKLPVTPPSATVRYWRFTLTKTAGIRLMIHCNDVEVLNILMSDKTCSNSKWTTYWNRDVTQIKFVSHDTASDYYRPGKSQCLD